MIDITTPAAPPPVLTPDQSASEKIGRSIDGQIQRLQAERAVLVAGPARIVEIDAELAILQTEKTRIDGRRPPRAATPPVVDAVTGKQRR